MKCIICGKPNATYKCKYCNFYFCKICYEDCMGGHCDCQE